MKLKIPGCDKGILEDRRRAKHSRGKGLVAGLEDRQNNKRGVFLEFTDLAGLETRYAAGPGMALRE